MTVTLYPFRYRSPLTGRWVNARYKATREDIAAGHAEWEIIGPAEVRDLDASARRFDPCRVIDHAPQLTPSLDADERFLIALFLRRYVTHCARGRRFAQMEGAARLYQEIAAAQNGRSDAQWQRGTPP
jgi:hypothetical protein